MTKKWKMTASQVRKLSAAVRNFNKKIYGLSVYVEPASYQDIKRRITDKRSFEAELNRLKRINRKGATDIVRNKAGFKMTKYERNEIQYQINAINNRRRALRKQLNLDSSPLSLDSTFSSLRPKHNFTDTIRSRHEWEVWKRTIEKQADPNYYNRLFQRYKDNLLTALRENWPKNDQRDMLEDMLEESSARQLWEIGSGEELTNINFIYQALISDAGMDIVMNRALREWGSKLGKEDYIEDPALTLDEDPEDFYI